MWLGLWFGLGLGFGCARLAEARIVEEAQAGDRALEDLG